MNPHVAGSLWGAGKPSEVISAPLSRNIDTVNTLEAKKSNIGVQRPRVLGGGTISPSKRESTSRVGIPRVTSVRARARPFTPKTHRRQVVHGRDAKVSPVGDVRPAGKKLAVSVLYVLRRDISSSCKCTLECECAKLLYLFLPIKE
eukprot:731781-Amorphochlora_amoeboformis.AAC.1